MVVMGDKGRPNLAEMPKISTLPLPSYWTSAQINRSVFKLQKLYPFWIKYFVLKKFLISMINVWKSGTILYQLSVALLH